MVEQQQQNQPEIDTKEHKSLQDFFQAIIKDDKLHKSVWRGESKSKRQPTATFERNIVKYLPNSLKGNEKHDKIFELRERLFYDFKLAMRGFRGYNPEKLSYNQIWALGRHFGLNTPLLDWSSSPFLAASFGVIDGIEKRFCTDMKNISLDIETRKLINQQTNEETNQIDPRKIFDKKQRIQDEDGNAIHLEKINFAVYQLILDPDFFQIIIKPGTNNIQGFLVDHIKNQIDQRHHRFIEDIEKNDDQLIRIFAPDKIKTGDSKRELLLFIDINVEELKRMQGQRGYFSIMHSAECLNIEEFLKKNNASYLIRKHIIEDHLDNIIQYLVLHGNDPKTLYPDLEGAAKQANLMLLVNTYHGIRN